MKLAGKVAVVPGGTAGIGKEIALAYAKEGAQVVVMSRNQERVSAMEKLLKEAGSEKSFGIAVDISDEQAVVAAFKHVKETCSKIDIMLNSAGIYPVAAFVETTKEEWDRVINVNLNGPFYCSREAAKYMIPQKNGRIIFITSGQALRGEALMAHYSASKGALVALARALAAELGPHGITVNTIAAGLTTTDTVNSSMPPQLLTNAAMGFPLQRLGRPDEYNGAAILLASDDGAYITGDTIAVDGGGSNANASHL